LLSAIKLILGDATVSDLQIFYLQKDPSSWLTKSSVVLDDSIAEISKFREQTAGRQILPALLAFGLPLAVTLVALIAGGFIAFYTAKSITEPLTHLITVAREIGDSGDLDQNIDIHRNDEIGALATTFNNMVAYLKEMASVSMAVAEGDLTVEVVPRSKRDTLGTPSCACHTDCRISFAPRAIPPARFPPVRIKSLAPPTNPPRSASKLLPPLKKSPAPCTK